MTDELRAEYLSLFDRCQPSHEEEVLAFILRLQLIKSYSGFVNVGNRAPKRRLGALAEPGRFFVASNGCKRGIVHFSV